MKVGDKVIVIKENISPVQIGTEGTITEEFFELGHKSHHFKVDFGNAYDGIWFFTPEELGLKVQQPVTIASGGTKHDSDKPDLSMLPFKSLEQVARVLQFGAQKYGRGNWKLGFKEERLVAAALRHLGAFTDGERDDKESGLSHIAHATCNLLFVLWFIETKSEKKE